MEPAGQPLSWKARWRWRRLRWLVELRKAGVEPINLVLGQTFAFAAVLSVLSLAVDALTSGPGDARVVLTGKVGIALSFVASAWLARVGYRRGALLVSLVVTVSVLAIDAATFGATPKGLFQLSSLWLLPFLSAVGTLGDLRSSLLAGLATAVSSLLVTGWWNLTFSERLLNLFVALLATSLAVAVALVLDEAKRQALHDERTARRVARRLAVAQLQKAQSERMAAMGQLASTMAHEINNPLAYTMANLRFIGTALSATEPVDSAELRMALQESEEGLHRIHSIVERMGAFRPTTHERGITTDVGHALTLFAASLNAARPLRAPLLLELEPALPAIGLDEVRLGRVLQGIIDNAFEATAATGGGSVRLVAQRVDGVVQLRVDDDGPGFEPEVLRRLFEPFVNPPGSKKLGLSLALARELLRSVGGDVRASNRPTRGASVVLDIPLA